MCHPTGARKTRTVCWMHNDCKWLLEHGYRAPLAITIDGATTGYWIEQVHGGWNLYKDMPDGTDPEVYGIAAFDRDDVTTWACSCQDAQWRSRRNPKHACKHCLALTAGLRRLGIMKGV